jgi:phosphoribosylamine--glycine ligase
VKVLILGSGGREHALAWRLLRDPQPVQIVSAPGNPGLAELGPVEAADLLNPDSVLALADRVGADLTVVGPEAPLEKGVVDRFRRDGRPIVGPTADAAALECSKVFAKHFMREHRIPTADFEVCTDADAARRAVAGDRFGFPVVVKADGLAAGKGVTVAADRSEADAAISSAMVDRQFGASGSRLVIEECLSGPEVSMFFLSDGEYVASLGSAQDHKRAYDDDRGPNTGGMGAFAPSPLASEELTREVVSRVVDPVIRGFRSRGNPYTGFLYVSLMLTPAGFRVIEFNVRFGDPEAQVVLPLIQGNLSDLLRRAATGSLAGTSASLAPDKAVGVVIASRGYPATSDPGREISGLDASAAVPGAIVFHAGTRSDAGRVVTAGGRVLTVVGRGSSFEEAIATAYRAVAAIQFDGMQYRRDIGRKALGGG